MGSENSTHLPAGAPGSSLKSQRDEDIPYTSYSISKPIDGGPLKQSPRSTPNKYRVLQKDGTDGTRKHNIVVVADGHVIEKDPDPELTKLNTIPIFYPILKNSVNVPTGVKDMEQLDHLDHQNIVSLCLRYQEHFKQLAEAVAFDENALCIRIKEIDCAVQMLFNLMVERQKKYAKYAEQFQRVTETLGVLNRIKGSFDNILPKMERLNQLLPPDEQLEPFHMNLSRPGETG